MGNKHSAHNTTGETSTPDIPQNVSSEAICTRQYAGQPCKYRFVNFAPINHTLSGPVVNSTEAMVDTNNYLPRMQQLYTEGYRILSFVVTLQTISNGQFQSSASVKCQAIFRKAREEEVYEPYALKLERLTLPKRKVVSGAFVIGNTINTPNDSATDHLFQVIGEQTTGGARLVCIEITGFNPLEGPMGSLASSSHVTPQHHGNLLVMPAISAPALGIDIFFEVPQFAGGTKFIYTCVPQPLHFSSSDSLFRNSRFVFEWFPLVRSYCESGWKLVEVFLDEKCLLSLASVTRLHGHVMPQIVDSEVLFFFEKDANKLHDNTPRYEVTVVEFGAKNKCKSGFAQVIMELRCEWEDTIGKMGEEGWEVVRILFTPHRQFSAGFSSVQTLLIFLQREIVSQPQETTNVNVTVVSDKSDKSKSDIPGGSVHEKNDPDSSETVYERKDVAAEEAASGVPVGEQSCGPPPPYPGL